MNNIDLGSYCLLILKFLNKEWKYNNNNQVNLSKLSTLKNEDFDYIYEIFFKKEEGINPDYHKISRKYLLIMIQTLIKTIIESLIREEIVELFEDLIKNVEQNN